MKIGIAANFRYKSVNYGRSGSNELPELWGAGVSGRDAVRALRRAVADSGVSVVFRDGVRRCEVLFALRGGDCARASGGADGRALSTLPGKYGRDRHRQREFARMPKVRRHLGRHGIAAADLRGP